MWQDDLSPSKQKEGLPRDADLSWAVDGSGSVWVTRLCMAEDAVGERSHSPGYRVWVWA